MTRHRPSNPKVRRAVWDMTGGRCFYCDVNLMWNPPSDWLDATTGGFERVFHVEHKVSKSAGGLDHISNYVPACKSCNSSKRSKSFDEFMRHE